MSRIFIANIYFQIICVFPNFPYSKCPTSKSGLGRLYLSLLHLHSCVISVNICISMMDMHPGGLRGAQQVFSAETALSSAVCSHGKERWRPGSSRQTQHRQINQTLLFSYSPQTHTDCPHRTCMQLICSLPPTKTSSDSTNTSLLLSTNKCSHRF